MSRIRSDQPLMPSVLDRLLDDEPDVRTEPTSSQAQVLRQVRNSVRRDLENLLNTRCRAISIPKEFTELHRSIVAYGIPDISGADLANLGAKKAFLRTVENTIRMFEPRFKTVKVSPLQNSDPSDRMLRFRIDAMMYAYPAPEPIVFDSALEPGSRNFEVQEPKA